MKCLGRLVRLLHDLLHFLSRLVSVLQRIEGDSHDDHEALDQARVGGRHGHQVQSVIQKSHQHRTEDRAWNSSDAARSSDSDSSSSVLPSLAHSATSFPVTV